MAPPGSPTKKAEESTNDNQPPKRHKNDNESILHSIPWTVAFQFLGGDDVAKALMASKHLNPWKMELVEGNEQQCIVSALTDRMMATEKGKELLQKYYDNKNPHCLPKLLYCMDRGYGIRYDGIYQCQTPGSTDSSYYLIFSPTGDMVSATYYNDPALMWNWFVQFYSRFPDFCKGTYECKFIPNGCNLFQFTNNLTLVQSLFIGQNGELIQIAANEPHSCEYTFVKM